MKSSFKYLACVSAVSVALFGTACAKKEEPKPQEEEQIEVVTPEVVERPTVICDDVGLKNRAVALVRDELYALSVAGLGKGATNELSQQLKARLSGIEIDLQNLSESEGECVAQLHVVLPNEEIAVAEKTFKSAGVASLEDQAVKNNVSLMGGNRLVGDFKFSADGEALAINTATPVMALASEVMATAVRSMVKTNKANAKRETAEIGKPNNDIIPAPVVQTRPVELPSIPQNKVPSPESAILRPEDVPSGKPQQSEKIERAEKSKAEKATERPAPKAEKPAEKVDAPKTETKTEVKSEPKSEPKAEPKSEPKAEPKSEPKPEPKAEPKSEPKPEPKKPENNEITIVETDETY